MVIKIKNLNLYFFNLAVDTKLIIDFPVILSICEATVVIATIAYFVIQVTWLASWTENVQGQVKYIMLNPSSKLKGEKDWQKYETARKLAKTIDKIRQDYIADWKSKEMRIRQRAVAMYFIDKVRYYY